MKILTTHQCLDYEVIRVEKDLQSLKNLSRKAIIVHTAKKNKANTGRKTGKWRVDWHSILMISCVFAWIAIRFLPGLSLPYHLACEADVCIPSLPCDY